MDYTQAEAIVQAHVEAAGLLGEWANRCGQKLCTAIDDMNTPFVILRPRLYPDGSQWCALYGDNLQDGVAGFGESPQEAAEDFNVAWRTLLSDKGETR